MSHIIPLSFLLPLIHPTFCHRNLQPCTLFHLPLSHQPHQVQVKPLHLLPHPLLNHQLFLVPLFLSLLLTNIPLLLGCPQLPTPMLEQESQLKSVESVVRSNSRSAKLSTIGRFACKLARHAVFGEAVLKRCTPLGRDDLPALPSEGMDKLKSILKQQLPFAQRNPAEFEELWEVCIIAIQHLCKRLRNN